MRLIDADALRYEIAKYFDGLPIQGHYDMLKLVDDAPTIEADIKCEDCKTIIALKTALEPVKRGKWEITEAYPHNVHCSICHKRYAQTHWAVWEDGSLPRAYCPNCGAKMEGEEA